ncbi:FkbM family methyltransferase [uncultured Aeromicrobium sp.]|uniref:FkbM family methyltransferase n=1 Tax=uncultured Aeromicrobium sp. TaxID=337820 RepID=UPI0025F11D49|nr:FkbM family methyltransferase [uncultured Aeromicrobium sp.]
MSTRAAEAATPAHDSVAVTLPNGRRIFVNPGDERGRTLIDTGGVFYPQSSDLWACLIGLRDWDLVLDVGCNYGQMLAESELGHVGRIIAYEPNPELLGYLRETIENLEVAVELRTLAVAERPGEEVSFLVDSRWSGTSRVKDANSSMRLEDTYEVTVPTTCLDFETEGSEGSVCLKIDTEGLELTVLQGGAKLLDGSRTVACMLEILHLEDEEVVDLARRYPLYLFVPGSASLRRLEADRDNPAEQLAALDIWRQDAAIIVGPDDPPTTEAEARRIRTLAELVEARHSRTMRLHDLLLRELKAHATTRENVAARDREIAQLKKQMSANENDIATLRARTRELDEAHRQAREEIEALWNSRSFRITAPLRALSRVLRRDSA